MTRPPTERRIVAVAVLIAIAGYLALWTCVKPSVFRHSKSDFGTFFRAGSMVLAGDGPCVYDLAAESRYDGALGTKSVDAEGSSVSLPFVFAPFALIFYAPFALLPYKAAEAAWYAANAGMLLALPLLLRKHGVISTKTCVFALIAPLLFLPAVLALMQGQPSILILLLFALAYADLANGKDARSGCWLALAGFKPQLVLPMLLAFLVWRKRQTLWSFLATSGALTLLSTFLVGWRATFSYPRALMQYAGMHNRLGAEHPASMPNLRGFLYVLLHAHMPASLLQKITLAISLVLLAATMLLLNRYRRISPLSFSLLVVVTLMTSYHAYLHDNCLLLLPMLLLGNIMLQSGRFRAPTAVTIATIFLLPLAPTSLTTTVWQMFLAIATLAALLAFQMWDGDGTATVKDVPKISPVLPV
jgi:hypothetical protein